MPALLKDWLEHSTEYEAAGRKLAIIAGSGGNSGALTCGALTAIHKTHTFPPNARYIGASTGAFTWMYTLLATGYKAPTLFGNQFCSKRLFRPRRLLRLKHPFIDMNYVVEELMEQDMPMDYARAQASSYQIHALTTCPSGGISLQPLTGVTKPQAWQTLKATAAMPLLSRTHDVENLAGWDGWLLEHHLLPHLQSLGITDVVWFLNRSSRRPSSWLENLIWRRVMHKLKVRNPRLANLIRARLGAGDFLATPPQGMQLEVFQPLLDISGGSRNSRQLFHALGISYRWMSTYLGQPNLPYPTEWAEWHHHMPKDEHPA